MDGMVQAVEEWYFKTDTGGTGQIVEDTGLYQTVSTGQESLCPVF